MEMPTAKYFLETNFAIMDDLEGISIAKSIPVIIEITISIGGFITFIYMRKPVSKVIKQNSSLVILIILSLLYLSANTPPKKLRSKTGVRFAVEIKPNNISESLINLISQSLP
tara:strand:+ start:3074 stop:3412 length:339 start_codon:yes stop_codon:yes gene_type:complete